MFFSRMELFSRYASEQIERLMSRLGWTQESMKCVMLKRNDTKDEDAEYSVFLPLLYFAYFRVYFARDIYISLFWHNTLLQGSVDIRCCEKNSRQHTIPTGTVLENSTLELGFDNNADLWISYKWSSIWKFKGKTTPKIHPEKHSAMLEICFLKNHPSRDREDQNHHAWRPMISISRGIRKKERET